LRKPSCADTHMGCTFLNIWLIRHRDDGYFNVASQSVTLLHTGRYGTFPRETVAALSGTYSVAVGTSLNAYAETIVRNSIDLMPEPMVIKAGDSGDPIQIVLSEGAIIEGTTMAAGIPAAAWVYAVPERPDGRLFHAITSDAQGKFRLEGLAPAEYTVFATDVELGVNLGNPKEVEYWQTHGLHVKPERGSSTSIVLPEIAIPVGLYPREAPPRTIQPHW
jgi:hypothetical protein